MVKMMPYPEWLERQDSNDQGEHTPWSVEPGQAVRGNAWTNIDAKRMRVPFGDDAVSRAVRAHEMVHAKVSPAAGPVIPTWASGVTEALVTACEEFRVNHLADRAGFDMGQLFDGSEKRTAELMAVSKSYDDIVFAIASMEGTGAIKPFMSGLRKAVKDGQADPRVLTHANAVRKMLRRFKKSWSSYHTHKRISSTAPHDVPVSDDESATLPLGYVDGSLDLAQELCRFLTPKNGVDLGPLTEEGDPAIPDRGGSAEFAPLILDKLPLTDRVAGRLGRKRIASNTGKDPRRINRMLTDPERRVFDRRAKGLGGVVLIDQSGSMHLSDSDVWDIIKAAPGCVIIGYSHNSGSTDSPNCWVLADRGKVVEHVRSGNGGNGVDAPALVYALSKRRNNEPVIWVCDGYVTSAHDNFVDKLADVCIQLVKKHGVHMVESVPSAIEAFGKVSRGERLVARLTGPLVNRERYTK